MTDATHVANYMLESILRDLSFLKDNNFIPNQAYKDVVNILPNRIQETSTTTMIEAVRPPLPIRKSTRESLVPASREVSSFPKLPTRRTNDWQPQIILPSEPEKATAPSPVAPPAYTQKPNADNNSLITAEALYDYHGEDPSTDLSFKQGNIIEVTEYGM